MAITAAALQTALGDGNHNKPRVVMQFAGEGYNGLVVDTLQHWLVAGGTAYPGRVVRIDTTASETAAQQASAVLTALLAGPA
jgi:hypothetical protein